MWEPQPPGALRACPGQYRDWFILYLFYTRIRGSAVSVVTGLRVMVRLPAEAGDLYLFHSLQTGCGTHPASVRGPFPRRYSGRGVKVTTDFRLMPSLRMSGAVHPLPMWHHGLHGGDVTFYLTHSVRYANRYGNLNLYVCVRCSADFGW
jgi:hypothetical protein